MRFQDIPIRRKLMTIIMGTSGVVLLLTCTAFLAYEVLTFRQTSVRQLSTLGDVIAANSTGVLAFDNEKDATEILAALAAEPHIVAACLYDREGKLFARYPAPIAENILPAAPGPDGYRFSAGHLAGFTPVMQVKGLRLGTLYLNSDLEAMYERIQLYGAGAVLVIGLASLVAYALSRTLQRQISGPILALAETATAVSNRRDYSVRARKNAQDELGLLTDAFNHMLAEIQKQNEMLEHRVRERTAELELANDELEAFCSSAAHDLRTPLRAITGFADILLDFRANIPPLEARRYIQLIRNGSGEMSDLIYALLAFSRHGRQALSRETVDLNQLCREAYQNLEGERAGRTVELRLQDLPPVDGDRALLRVVFINLLSNAQKYTRPRDVAIIEVGVIADEDDGEPVYFVRDNGVGFDVRDADRLFGVFQRLHHAHEFEGTGVGLATVRRIIERHGGRIWAEAAQDAGATFYFRMTPRM